MKKIFKIISVLSVMAIILTTSCSEKERTWLADLQIGAYIQFEEVPNAVQGVDAISDLNYAGTFVDPTGNVAEYELYLNATLSGTPQTEALVDTYTNFPIDFSFTAADLAAILGVSEGDINFGDSFDFRGVVTHKNGTVYTGEPPSYDSEEGVLDLAGKTNDEIPDPNNGYRSAFIFGFQIGCPANTYTPTDFVGTYHVSGGWHWSNPANNPDGLVTISIDPSDSNILVIDGYSDLWTWYGAIIANGEPLRVEVNPETNYASAIEEWLFSDFIVYGRAYVSGGGTIFPCASGDFALDLAIIDEGGPWGTFTMTFEKQ